MICDLKGEDIKDWKRREVDSTHLPFYVNNRTGEISWDHPEFKNILEATEKYEALKYCTYRTAFKIRSIQKALKWNVIKLQDVIAVLEENRFGLDGSQTVTCQEVEHCLLLLYDNVKKELSFVENSATLADLMLNFLLNVFLPKRNRATFSSVQVQIVLVLMSAGRLLEKYKCIHHYMSVAIGGVCRENLELLFDVLWKIPILCGENLRFGPHFVPLAVESLLHSVEDVSEENFLNWAENEPQNLIWAPVLYRISISESVIHEARCSVCQLYPIVGLRFKCLHCMGYSMCQNCFLQGLSSGTHHSDHPTREYVHPVTRWDEGRTTLEVLKNRLFSKRKSRNVRSFESLPNFLERACLIGNTKVVACNDSVWKELSTITEILESASKKLLLRISAVQESPIMPCDSTTNCPSSQRLIRLQNFLEEHSNIVNMQVHQLRLLTKFSGISEDSKNPSRRGKLNEMQSPELSGLNSWSKVARVDDGSATLSVKDLQYTITDLTAGYSSCDSIAVNVSTTFQPSQVKANKLDRIQGDSLTSVSIENQPYTLDMSSTDETSSFKSRCECGFGAGPDSTIKVTNSEVLNIVKDIDGLFSLSEGLPNGFIQKEQIFKALQGLREKLAVACPSLTTADSTQSTDL